MTNSASLQILLSIMLKFIQLAEAQDGHTTSFEFTSRQGKVFQIEISVHARCAMIRKNCKYIGSVDYNRETGSYTIMGWNSTPAKRYIQLFVEECEKEDSCITPAWKQAIVDRFQKRINDAQIALALTMKNLSTI